MNLDPDLVIEQRHNRRLTLFVLLLLAILALHALALVRLATRVVIVNFPARSMPAKPFKPTFAPADANGYTPRRPSSAAPSERSSSVVPARRTFPAPARNHAVATQRPAGSRACGRRGSGNFSGESNAADCSRPTLPAGRLFDPCASAFIRG